MLIILEGPDGSGKSTLARQLADYLTTHGQRPLVLHAGPPTRHPLDEYLRPLTEYRPSQGTDIILDRWHWGEKIYPAVFNRSTQLDAPTWWYIENYLLRLGAVVVRCNTFTSTYDRVYDERGESPQVVSALPDVLREYAYLWSTLPQVHYNWESRHNTLDQIKYAALAQASHNEVLNQFTTYVGPRNPRYLLFGDVRHHMSSTERQHGADPHLAWDPAFVPLPGTSGHYLLSALDDVGVHSNVGLTNACDSDDPVELWKTLGEPRVVTLGRNASRRLEKLGLPHVTVPHPQYIRRFFHRQRLEYGALIRQALELRTGDDQWPTSSQDAAAPTSTTRSSAASIISVDREPVVTATSSS